MVHGANCKSNQLWSMPVQLACSVFNRVVTVYFTDMMPGADCKSNQVRQIDAAAVQSRSDVYAADPCFLKVPTVKPVIYGH